MWAILKAVLFFRVVILGAMEFATLEDPSTDFFQCLLLLVNLSHASCSGRKRRLVNIREWEKLGICEAHVLQFVRSVP
jgi:hypothetical protein